MKDNGVLHEIIPLDGYSPTVGHLVSMLGYARSALLAAVRDLGVVALDFLIDEEANSIGMLLEHIASVEEFYQQSSFGAVIGASDRWRLGAELGSDARVTVRGNGLDYYLDRLMVVRSRTLAELRLRDEAWLFEVGPMGRNLANNYFKWFHVVEEELGHTAQIRLVRKRLPELDRRIKRT